jgi:hypothetical protein
MAILKVIGRKEAEPEMVLDMMDPSSATKIFYTHEDPEGLILYDCGFAGVDFRMGDANIRHHLELWGSKLIQKRLLEVKILDCVLSKYQSQILGDKPVFPKAEYPKSFKRVKAPKPASDKPPEAPKSPTNGDKNNAEDCD